MKRRILIVEDEPLIARALAFSLRREAFDVEIAADGVTALELAVTFDPDLVLLDLMLPGDLTGYDVCEALRRETNAPIVIVSARGAEIDKVLGFERGADDYVTKPFSTAELAARIRAHLRRVTLDHDERGGVRRVGSIVVDTVRRLVTVGGERVQLTPSEFTVMDALSVQPEAVVTRDELMARLWQSDFSGDTRACEAHVRRLRAKIETDPRRPERLLTVRGVGYKLVA